MQRKEQQTKKQKEQIAATIYIFDAKISKKQLKDTDLEPHQDEKPNRLLPISKLDLNTR